MGRKQDLIALRRFKEALSKKILVDRMILFGSRARGTAKKDSDFDLLIVSPSFRKKPSIERPVGLYLCWDINSPFDFLCYTPEEFKKLSRQWTIVRDAVREGVEI